MSARPATAIVLARAGSKGLPGKNTMPLRGKACIAWTIEHALASERVGRVVVSTDGAEIAAVARSCGAEVVDRPDELAGDGATIDDAARHAVAELGEGSLGGRVALLYANVPVRPPDLTDRALAPARRDGRRLGAVLRAGREVPHRGGRRSWTLPRAPCARGRATR